MTFPIIDGHNDTLLKLFPPDCGPDAARLARAAFYDRFEQGHFDLQRARQGNLGAGFFAICAPPLEELNPDKDPRPEYPALDPVRAQKVTLSVLAQLLHLERESGGEVRIVRTTAELDTCMRLGILAVVLHLEGAEAIDPQLDLLHILHRTGLRSLGIVWSRPNAFGHGVCYGHPRSPDTGPGLTDAGFSLVRACNELGILVDVAHLNEKGFWDVARSSAAPLVATHSAAHAICPSTRNLTDAQLDAIGYSDGLVGVNFHVGFLRPDGARDAATPLSEIGRHVRYIADRIGIGCVALGSDFDGALMPEELGDVAGLPKLIEALRRDGFDDEALRKITHENWLRVLRRTWRETP